MVGTGGVAASQRTLLEMAFEDVTAREGVFAQVAHVWTIAGVSKQMTLQVLRVQICLVTVRAGILAIGVLLRDHALRGGATTLWGRIRSSWRTRENSAASLRAHDVGGLLFVLHEGGSLSHLAHLLACLGETRQAAASTHHAPRWHRA